MNVVEIEIHNKVNIWIAFAEEDLRMAQYAITMKNAVPYRLIAFHAHHGNWAGTIEEAKRLTLYAITTRYPGTEDKVTMDEALNAIDLASRVRQVVRSKLAEEGMNIEEETPQ